MNSDEYRVWRTWWMGLDDAEKLSRVAKQARETLKALKAKRRAQDAELAHGFSRTGIRGGRFTTLSAQSHRAAEYMIHCEEELRRMVSTLNL